MKKIVLFMVALTVLHLNVFAEDITDIENQIQELQARKIEVLNSQQKVLEAQRAEQDKKQKELEEKQQQLLEKEKYLNEAMRKNGETVATAENIAKAQKNGEVIGKVVYVEAPSIVGVESKETKGKKLTGADAVKQSVTDSTVVPEYSDGSLKAFVYKEQMLYQVHCQTFHTTMIQLEPGEQLLEVPYISESEVWRLSRGTGLSDGMAVQYLMLKPDKSGLDSTMIIITDRRVYQLQIKSFSDHYMPFVRWVYNNTSKQTWNLTTLQQTAGNGKDKDLSPAPTAIEDIIADVADIYSFNYEIKSMTSKSNPSWMPVTVFDDGQSTYIILDKKCINMDMPSVFENVKDIVNKNVKKNVIVINKLVKKLTLKLGSERVTIRKL